MNKREHMLELISNNGRWPYVPAAFFTHFGKEDHAGQGAIDRHLEFFRYTDMDFVKIQFEFSFPRFDFIEKPEDWRKVPRYGKELFEEPLAIVKGLSDEIKGSALIIQTVYSPYSCAAASTSYDLITEHIAKDPDSVRTGLSIMAENLQVFVDECRKNGADGFYSCTQGGEDGRFRNDGDFSIVKESDLKLFEYLDSFSSLNILHICDYWLKYRSLGEFVDYPGNAVSCPTSYSDGSKISSKEVADMFHRIVFGGLDRKGAIKNGPMEAAEKDAKEVLSNAPDRFILGADCTVADADWDILKKVIRMAHEWRS